MTILFVFAICLMSSAIGGVCGIGGGVVIKPVLDAAGIMSVSTASFLSGLTVLAMSVISVYKNRGANELDTRRSVPLGIGAAVGGVVGKQLFELIKRAAGADRLVGAAQAVLLGVMVLGTLPVSRLTTRLAVCESRMIRRELTAAFLVSMEKK